MDDFAMELMAAVRAGASAEEIRELGERGKRVLADAFYDLWRRLALIDSLVAVYAPDPLWRVGWLAQAGEPGSPPNLLARRPGSARSANILAIADSLLAGGSTTIVSEAIAERLAAQMGTTAPRRRTLLASVSCTLVHAGWRKVGAGEYAPPERGGAV